MPFFIDGRAPNVVAAWDSKDVVVNRFLVALLVSGFASASTVEGGVLQLLEGADLRLERKSGRLTVVSRDPILSLGGGSGTTDDPTIEGGSVAIASAGDLFPPFSREVGPIGWRRIPGRAARPLRGWRHQGEVTVIVSASWKNPQLKVSAKLPSINLPDSTDAPISVLVRLGDQRYCLEFGGRTKHVSTKKLHRVDADRPPACRLGSTTTTSAVTTTTAVCQAVSGSFCDLGDGTVVDSATGLQWEKKTAADWMEDPSSLHDADNIHQWAGWCSVPAFKRCQVTEAAETACRTQTSPQFWAFGCDRCAADEGTCARRNGEPVVTVWDWLVTLNASAFAGHADWRLPTVAGCCGLPTGEPAELETIVSFSHGSCRKEGGPCIDPIFGPTGTDVYWSGTTETEGGAWKVHFYNSGNYEGGGAGYEDKSSREHVRAVR